MGNAEGELAELVVDVVEDSTWLEEELAWDLISTSQAAVWFSCPLGECCTASSARSWSTLARQGTARVGLAQVTPNDHDDVGLGGVSSKRRWLPARVGTRSSLARDATLAGGDSKAQDGDPSRTNHRCCSVILSPCLADALGLLPPSAHSETSSSNRTSAAGKMISVEPQQLCLRELPSSLVALASAVELSGPHPVSSATGRLEFFGGNKGGQSSEPAQQQAQLAAAVSSILPCALDGQVLAEGSIVRVAGLFGLIVTEVRTEEERRGEQAAKSKREEAGELQSSASAGRGMVRVHGSTELRLSPPTQSVRVGVAVNRNSSPLTPIDSNGFGDEDAGSGGDGAAAADRLAARISCSWLQSSPGHDDKAASQAATASGPDAAALSPASPPYSSLDVGEWVRRVEQDFGGLGNQVARAIAAVGSALRGGGRGRHHGQGGELRAPASGLLLHGPTGVGKTLLARSISEHSGAAWFFLDCASVFRRDRGKAEQYVQDFFNNAGACSPSVVVLDQIESVCRKRPEAAGITELQVLSVLLETMDRFRRSSSSSGVFFLATCPDSTALDPSLLQRGRLETVLRLGALDSAARTSVLVIHARGMPLELQPPPSSSTDAAAAAVAGTTSGTPALAAISPLPLPRTREEFLRVVAARCHGYLGSDLERLCREAAMSHMSTSATSEACAETSDATMAATTATLAHGPYDAGRRCEGGVEVVGCVEPNDDREDNGSGDSDGGGSGVRLQDFWAALNVVRPASLVGHSVGMWGGDVGQQRVATEAAAPLVGCDAAMAELRAFILTPLANPSLLRDLGLRGATGALLHGPPGCGKTSVARALAVEVQGVANFLEVRCSDLVDKVVGRSEKNVSDLFAAARAAAPCVLFLDQVEGVAARRGYHSSTEQTFDRILSTLLVEMDGVTSESGGHVVVLAATNDIERLDPALLRPGRLDRRVHLGNPDSAARTAIFLQCLANMPLQMEGGSAEEVGQGREGQEGGDDSGAERDTTAAPATDKDIPSSGSGSGSSSSSSPGVAVGGAETSSAQCIGQHSICYSVESGNDGLTSGVPPRPEPPRRRRLLDSTEAYAEWLAGETEGSSGAHVTGVCREAALAALREGIGAVVVAPRHFEAVLGGQ